MQMCVLYSAPPLPDKLQLAITFKNYALGRDTIMSYFVSQYDYFFRAELKGLKRFRVRGLIIECTCFKQETGCLYIVMSSRLFCAIFCILYV